MRHIMLILNPKDDLEFTGAAERLASDLEQPEELARALRVLYPAVVVRPRDLSGEYQQVWYVYRDGHWVPRLT